MSKRKYAWDEKKVQKCIKEGYGQGEGKDYKSWLTTYDFPSIGRVTRLFGVKTQRIHYFMSDLETRYYDLLEWSDNVIDIREQYPLLDLKDAMDIAENKGIRYPMDKKSKTPIILTTDFMVTLKENGKIKYIARTIKYAKDLDKKRVIEKFEIEKAYWEKRDISWGIVTEREISRTKALNIEWALAAHKLEGISSEYELQQITNVLKFRLANNSSTIRSVLKRVEKEYNLEIGTALYLLRHLIFKKEVIVDMDAKIDITKPMQLKVKGYSESTIMEAL